MEADMKSKKPGRRQFLKKGAVLAGAAMGAMQSAKGQTGASDLIDGRIEGTKYVTAYGERSRFEQARSQRIHDYEKEPFPAKKLTPLQDSVGIITPSPMHFVADHYVPPDIDPSTHRLMIHGMVDRPLIFTMEDLKRLPSVSRVYFMECLANSSLNRASRKDMDSVQRAHGRTSCSEWTGVPLSVLLQQAGVQSGASWLYSEGSDGGRYSYSLPMAKAMDDVLVAYGQNGEAVRPEQGYPLRLLAPGWEGPFSVKWLRRIKVVNQPQYAKTEVTLHGYLRPDLKGKALWFQFEMPPKSVITRPSGGQKLPGPGSYEITGLAWSGGGVIRRVEVSTDGGRTWQDAALQEPVHSKAHTRFRLGWNWDGEEAVIQSRCTDERGERQPSLEEMSRRVGVGMDYWIKTSVTAFQFNPIQPWRVTREGEIHNAILDSVPGAPASLGGDGSGHTDH